MVPLDCYGRVIFVKYFEIYFKYIFRPILEQLQIYMLSQVHSQQPTSSKKVENLWSNMAFRFTNCINIYIQINAQTLWVKMRLLVSLCSYLPVGINLLHPTLQVLASTFSTRVAGIYTLHTTRPRNQPEGRNEREVLMSRLCRNTCTWEGFQVKLTVSGVQGKWYIH